jgi:hypothetical protein
MSDYDDDFSDNRENIDPRRRDFVTSGPVKVPIFTYLLLGRNVWDNFFVT